MKNIVLKLFLILIILQVYPNLSLLAQSQKSAKKLTYVIVHGAWGGSWAFKNVDSLLTAKGHTVYRPSLTGQGERVHLASPNVNLSTHILDVVNFILFEDLKDIILVGHSYGGMVITGVADSLPGRIKQLVYLDAYVPNNGESVIDLSGNRGKWYMTFEKDGFLVAPWVKSDGVPPGDVPQPLKTFTEQIKLVNTASEKLPTAYILTVDKGKKAEEDDFSSSYNRAREKGWKVYQMQADHNPQWSAVGELAKMLNEVVIK